jgi:hypothetical protein
MTNTMNLRSSIFAFATSLVSTVTALSRQPPVGPAPAPSFADLERTTNVLVQVETLQRCRVFECEMIVSATGADNAFPSLIASPPAWMFSREWNAVRLTVRGVGEADEAATVRFGPNPIFLILR